MSLSFGKSTTRRVCATGYWPCHLADRLMIMLALRHGLMPVAAVRAWVDHAPADPLIRMPSVIG